MTVIGRTTLARSLKRSPLIAFLFVLVLLTVSIGTTAGREGFSLVTWNVRGYPETTLPRREWFSDQLARLDADILCIQEIANDERVEEFLQAEPLYDKGAFSDSSDGQDNAIFFKRDVQMVDFPDPPGFRHPAQLTYAICNGVGLFVLTVHLTASDPAERADERQALARFAHDIRFDYPDMPLIVAGDFNTSGSSGDTIEGLVESTGLVAIEPDGYAPTTCHGSHFDYLLVSPRIVELWSVKARVVRFDDDQMACAVSDHYPVIAEFVPEVSNEGSLPLTIVSLTSPVSPGADATLRAKTIPNASCSIEVYYKSGLSEAAGLETKPADPAGDVSWTWRVGSRTAPGDWRIVVTATLDGRQAKREAYLTVE